MAKRTERLNHKVAELGITDVDKRKAAFEKTTTDTTATIAALFGKSVSDNLPAIVAARTVEVGGLLDKQAAALAAKVAEYTAKGMCSTDIEYLTAGMKQKQAEARKVISEGSGVDIEPCAAEYAALKLVAECFSVAVTDLGRRGGFLRMREDRIGQLLFEYNPAVLGKARDAIADILAHTFVTREVLAPAAEEANDEHGTVKIPTDVSNDSRRPDVAEVASA